jgi:hypothetical protein
MIITLLSLPLKDYSYKLEHIVPKIWSPLNLLGFHPLTLLILINHKKELQSMNHSPKDHLFFLRSPLLFPTRCMSPTGASPTIYLGFLIEYNLPPIGFVRTIALGTVALGWSQKNPAFLRRQSQIHLKARKVFYREMRYRALSRLFIQISLTDGRPSRSTSSRSCTLPHHHRITSLSHVLSNPPTNKLPYFFSRNSRSPILASAPRSSTLYAPGDLR